MYIISNQTNLAGEYILTPGLTDSNSVESHPKKVVLLTPGYPGVNILLIHSSDSSSSLFVYTTIRD